MLIFSNVIIEIIPHLVVVL